MKDLFEDYCTHISKDEDYDDIFGRRWFKDENETIHDDNLNKLDDEDFDAEDDIIIKNLGYLPQN